MSILNNAKDSITMGLEDYNSPDPKRLISCTRNLFAGILLLFKHKLSLLSPANSDEALIKQSVLPKFDTAGAVIWTGQGKKTVDVQQILERFNSLGISVPWDRVDAINKFRNDVEHYYSQKSKDSIRGLLSNSFIVIRDFLSQHLEVDPRDFLGDEAWNILTSVSEVYEREKDECLIVLGQVNWRSESLQEALSEFECQECGSGLISIRAPDETRYYNNNFYCRSCGTCWDFEEIAEKALKEFFAYGNYVAIKEGGEQELIPCPECSNLSYVYHEQRCVLCGVKLEHVCQRCSAEIISDEFDGSGYCSWCAKMISNDD